jgi:uroporphyrinogen III methyltransferase / synthase
MQTVPLQSLAGVRIMTTRPKTEEEPLTKKLRELGAIVMEFPTIAILPVENFGLLDGAIRTFSEFEWVIFTSTQGVRFFGERMAVLGLTDNLRGVKVAAIGPATASALSGLGKKPSFMPDEFLSQEIARGLGDVKGKRILLPRADIASKTLPDLLRKLGATVDEVVAYRTVIPNDVSRDQLRSIVKQGVDVVTFTSPSTVRNLATIAGAGDLEAIFKGVKVACIGPVTAEATRELGLHVDIVASNHTIDDLVEAIVNEIRTV